MNSNGSNTNAITFIPFILLSVLIFSIYSNTLNSSWHLDDEPNIERNSRLHIDNLMPSTLYQTFFAYPGTKKKLYRPLPCLTFAINWYFGKNDTTGYHLVNIFIHILTVFILFVTALSLFETPVLKHKYSKEFAYLVSLGSSALWAINPMHTSAVTYIVQRMAAMAALFYLLGIFFYLNARLSSGLKKRFLFYSGLFVSYLFAIGSKENTVLLPFAIVLIEFIFFQKDRTSRLQYRFIRVGLELGLLFFLIVVLFYFKGDFSIFAKGYENRYFNFSERLMTQPRVIILYISQLFYPIPQRFSMAHDVSISHSLFDPWTTLPSIFLILLLIGYGFFQMKRNPLISFPILFFFLNHLIESTIIPLELVFEHRNYLPSLFLFIPVSLGFFHLLKGYSQKSSLIHIFLFTTGSLILISIGFSTYIRNMDWQDEQTLWQDAMIKAPGHARPINVVAINLAWGKHPTPMNQWKAQDLFKRSLNLYKPSKFLEAGILGNIAMIYSQQGDGEKGIQYYFKAIAADPALKKIRYDAASLFALEGIWDEASKHLDFLLKADSNRADWLNLKGLVLLWQDKPEEALQYLRKALKLAPDKPPIWLNIGIALTMMHEFKSGQWFLNRAIQLAPDDIITLFSLIENRIKAEDLQTAKHYAKKLCSLHSISAISDAKAKLLKTPKTMLWAPVSMDLVLPLVEQAFRKLTSEFPNEIFQQNKSTD